MDKDVSGALRRLLLLAMLGLPLVAAAAVEPQRLVDAARAQVGVTLGYDPAYRQLDYPGGDVPLQTGSVPTWWSVRCADRGWIYRRRCTRTCVATSRPTRSNGE